MDITFHPIGYVQNEFDEPMPPDELRRTDSTIVIDESFVEGLTGLEPGQQLLVLFYFDRVQPPVEMMQHYKGNRDLPKRGLFTLRTPNRPNPIGATVVKIREIDGNRLLVHGLDALNGSPVLDIKLEE